MEPNKLKNSIHPTAILEGHIAMGDGNEIGPYAVLRGHIEMGDNNTIGTGVSLTNTVRLGSNNRIYPYASIGAPGEMGVKGDRLVDDGRVYIGHNVTIREFVCIHSPVYSLETTVYDDVYIMNKSYVAHDCVINQGCVLSAGVLLAGRCTLGENVTMGLGVTVHQGMTIGAYAMIGMQAPVTRNILPYCTVAGNPARIIGFNRKGAERGSFEKKWLDEMDVFFQSEINSELNSENPLINEVYAFLDRFPESLLKIRYRV